MEMIKSDLKKLGISHNSFISEKSIVNSKNVEHAIKELRKNNYVEEGYLDPPKGEETKDWKKLKDSFLNLHLLAMIQIEHCKKMMVLGLILQTM